MSLLGDDTLFHPVQSQSGRRILTPQEQVPMTAPVGDTILRCSCGNVESVDSRKLIVEGWVCKCGRRCVPGRGDPCKPNKGRSKRWNKR